MYSVDKVLSANSSSDESLSANTTAVNTPESSLTPSSRLISSDEESGFVLKLPTAHAVDAMVPASLEVGHRWRKNARAEFAALDADWAVQRV